MLIPYGLDDANVSRVPWVSIALLAANVLVWIATGVVSDHERHAQEAGAEVERYLEEHPYLRAPSALERFGLGAGDRAQPPASADVAAEQAQLDALAEAFVETWEAQPAWRFGLVPARGLAQPGWLTHMFLHGGFMHLLGNMLVFFLICAPFLEDAWGAGFFLGFYLLGGLFAAIAQALPDMSSQIPCVGASGAISACLGAFSVRFATRRVRVAYLFFLPPLRIVRGTTLVRAWAWGLLGLGGDLLGLAMSSGSQGGGVAYAAHVGGFLFGAVAAFAIARSGREFRQARASGDFVVHPSVEKGDEALALGRAGQARAEYERALAASPSDGEARLRLYRLELAEGRADDAVAHLERLSAAADRSLFTRAAQDALAKLEPTRLRPATALRLAEAAGPEHHATARSLADVAIGAGGALGARALVFAAEMELACAPQAALELASRATQAPGASADTVARAQRTVEGARADLQRLEGLSELELATPATQSSAAPAPERTPAAPGEDAAAEPAPGPPSAPGHKVFWCRLLAVDDETLALESTGGHRSRLPLGRVEALAVGVVEQLGAPVAGRVVVTDLRLRPAGAGQAAVHLRLPSPWLGLASLHPGVPAQEAFSRLIRHVLDRSGATPHPSAAQVAGPAYARFPDLAAFEAKCWGPVPS